MGFDVEGKTYESLDQVPAELRTMIENALASGDGVTRTITVNGKTYASLDDVPAPLRGLLRGAVGMVASRTAPMSDAAVRPEPVLSLRTVLGAAGLAALLFWLFRSVF